MVTDSRLLVLVLLSSTICYQSASTPQTAHTLSRGAFNSQHIESNQRSSGELIDVYLSNDKLSLRCSGINQALQFTTSTDQKLVVDTTYTNIEESGVFQASYERIFGVYKLPLAYCVAFIKSSEPANDFLGGDYGVRKIKEVSYVVIPIPSASSSSSSSNSLIPRNSGSSIGTSTSTSSSTQSDIAKQKEALSLMQATFSRHSFYYSSGFYDVTRNFQSNIFQLAKTAANTREENAAEAISEVLQALLCILCYM